MPPHDSLFLMIEFIYKLDAYIYIYMHIPFCPLDPLVYLLLGETGVNFEIRIKN